MNATHTVTMVTMHKRLKTTVLEREYPCRVMPKTILCREIRFNRQTGLEIYTNASVWLSYRHHLLLDTLKPLPRVGRNRRAK